ncbi:hypothetical protein K493DRAFT_16295 [Basidiobolus meristosporus CBS 931.73]|uniref:Hydrophobin n=1 Tax=Basidiobolus meristosporus CBS 931.73 TaxID=1314790 RepID=A0A1Y1Z8X1_9FUNG|nr:hypothetical protein K493DRAFT_16295 [Basidiobolus meristosporus CBS 931.73]|eukprot:ORY06730.1 hypothetical protein K493DRAFT_16295 [Basidiobolus meristosporus CBS 931.73]
MKFLTVLLCLAALLSVAFTAPLPLDLGSVVGGLTRPVTPAASSVLHTNCNDVVAKAQVLNLVNVDAVICLDSTKPVPVEVEQAVSQVSHDCNILKNSITAKIDALGLLKVRALVCLPKVVLYVSL